MKTNALMAFSIICSMMGVCSMRMYVEHKRWVFMVYAGGLISTAALAGEAVAMHD